MLLLEPPSVAGWEAYYQQPGYDHIWITSATLPLRNGLSDAMLLPNRANDRGVAILDTPLFVTEYTNPGDSLALIDDINAHFFTVPFSENMRMRLAAPPAALEFGRRRFANMTAWSAIEEVKGKADPMVVEGLLPPYAVPDVAVYHVPVELPLPSGRMRANAHGYTCFAIESFIDEVAQRKELEPLSFRISMLGGDTRLAECLQRAARLGEWDGGGRGTGQGLACHRMDLGEASGRIAVVATASAGEGGVRVRTIAAAVDIGRVDNRDIALQQIEGGLLFGLSLATGSATDYDEGRPVNNRLAALSLPQLADCPRITIELVESDGPPFDPGEIGVPAIAPAVANALYSATGLRFRRLPLLSGGL